jgi:hypothetical protein
VNDFNPECLDQVIPDGYFTGFNRGPGKILTAASGIMVLLTGTAIQIFKRQMDLLAHPYAMGPSLSSHPFSHDVLARTEAHLLLESVLHGTGVLSLLVCPAHPFFRVHFPAMIVVKYIPGQNGPLKNNSGTNSPCHVF